MRQSWHSSLHGIRVLRSISRVPYRKGLDHMLRELDTYRGIYLSSGYEYPGRYSRWDIASVQPPLEIVATGREMLFRPLNLRGEMIAAILFPILAGHPQYVYYTGMILSLYVLLKLIDSPYRLNVIGGFSDMLAEEIAGLAAEDARLESVLGDVEQVRGAGNERVCLDMRVDDGAAVRLRVRKPHQAASPSAASATCGSVESQSIARCGSEIRAASAARASRRWRKPSPSWRAAPRRWSPVPETRRCCAR